MPETATSMLVDEESKKQKQGNVSITTTSSTTKPVSSSSSVLHTVLLYVAILGLGAIVGYKCFSSIYSHKCSDMIDEIERKCAQTSEHLSNQLKDARLLEQHLERTSATVDESVMVELRGRLSKQESLIEHFEKREMKDTDTLIQLTYQNEKYKEILTELQGNILEMQSKLNFETAEKASLQQQLQEAVEIIKVAETETSSAHVRLLHSSLILEVFGEDPYYVQFDVNIDGETEPAVFVVEVTTLESTPTSVFNFLTLVDDGIYEGAEFLSTHSIIHLDSDEDKVKGIAYAISGLRLVENSSLGRCAPYSFGFVGSNGGLKFIMTHDASKHGTLACFGSIIQGRQVMSSIQRAAQEGRATAVSSARIVMVDSPPSVTEGEL